MLRNRNTRDRPEEQIERLGRALDEADAVLIGAGAGLSTSAGFTYDGPRFEQHFSAFARRYQFHDMYSGGFYPFPGEEERWAFWSRMILINRYEDPPRPVHRRLLELVGSRDYFVLTTNVDHCFQKAGFARERLFYTQGDYGLFQCSLPCRQETWDNEDAVRAMVAAEKDLRVPAELVPRCPHCGRPVSMALRSDETFVEDDGWHQAAARYDHFLRTRMGTRLLLLELGVGGNTPGIIKYPFWRLAAQNPDARYVCINKGQAFGPRGIADRSICINADIGDVIDALPGRREAAPAAGEAGAPSTPSAE